MGNTYEHLFSPIKIGNRLTLKNRFSVAAMGTGDMGGTRGEYRDNTIEYYLERAPGRIWADRAGKRHCGYGDR